MKVNVVILAAGLGTRMRSKRAKVLHRAGGMTLVEHVVNTALAIAAPENIVVVVGHQAAEVRENLAHTGVRFVEQTEQKGTGHALSMCRGALESSGGLVVVIYGDGPLLSAATLRRLIDAQRSSAAAATLITTTLEDPSGYGRVLLDDQGHVVAIVEQKAATPTELSIRLVNSGIYCFDAALLWRYLSGLQPNSVAGEYYLTDMAEILTAAGKTIAAMHIDDPYELLGINTRVELAMVDRIFRERKVQELMLAGVTVEKPETVTVDTEVTIGMDTVVEAGARILGKTRIGEDCRVGAYSIVQDSELGDRVDVGPFTMINASRVDADAHVGPFARLRLDNHVEAGAHIGNFVELKKTHLGAGAKASHLAYLGDSDVGGKVNIGAGTITCNYDGKTKHPTRIGAGAFVGSNSTLVAPIELGEGSYIGAGSVITDRVPPDALAIGRGRQVIKEGWAEKKRARKT